METSDVNFLIRCLSYVFLKHIMLYFNCLFICSGHTINILFEGFYFPLCLKNFTYFRYSINIGKINELMNTSKIVK